MEPLIPPALVLGCNTPHGINVLSDWIEEQTGITPDFAMAGWSDSNGRFDYGDIDGDGDGMGFGYGFNNGDGYGDGFGFAFSNGHPNGFGLLYSLHTWQFVQHHNDFRRDDGYGYGAGNGNGWGNGYGDGNGDGVGNGSGYDAIDND